MKILVFFFVSFVTYSALAAGQEVGNGTDGPTIYKPCSMIKICYGPGYGQEVGNGYDAKPGPIPPGGD